MCKITQIQVNLYEIYPIKLTQKSLSIVYDQNDNFFNFKSIKFINLTKRKHHSIYLNSSFVHKLFY